MQCRSERGVYHSRSFRTFLVYFHEIVLKHSHQIQRLAFADPFENSTSRVKYL